MVFPVSAVRSCDSPALPLYNMASIGGTISYTYRIHVAPINRPVLSSVLFISFVYISITINTLLSSGLAVYVSSILLMRLWPIRQRLLTGFVGTRIRSI
jgi:hypothetical protein